MFDLDAHRATRKGRNLFRRELEADVVHRRGRLFPGELAGVGLLGDRTDAIAVGQHDTNERSIPTSLGSHSRIWSSLVSSRKTVAVSSPGSGIIGL